MSKLQDLARKRNSAKGRVKGLRNNLRGLLRDDCEFLTQREKNTLSSIETGLSTIYADWEHGWEQIKENL